MLLFGSSSSAAEETEDGYSHPLGSPAPSWNTSSYTVWEVWAGQCPPFKKTKSGHGGHLLTHKTHANASWPRHSVLGATVLPARSPPAQKKPPTFPSHLRSIAAARNPHLIRVKRAQAFPITSLSLCRKMTEKLGSWLCGFTGQCPQG